MFLSFKKRLKYEFIDCKENINKLVFSFNFSTLPFTRFLCATVFNLIYTTIICLLVILICLHPLCKQQHLYSGFSKHDCSLLMQRVFTQDWLNSYHLLSLCLFFSYVHVNRWMLLKSNVCGFAFSRTLVAVLRSHLLVYPLFFILMVFASIAFVYQFNVQRCYSVYIIITVLTFITE